MTTKKAAPPSYGPTEQFPERPRRTDMQNVIHLHYPSHLTALRRRLDSPDTTLIIGEMPVRRSFQPGLAPETLRYPDLLVAFNVDCAEAIARRGFAIDHQGKPPDFALEIASLRTAENDYTTKRADYASFGIPEYWRFDNTGGRLYPEALAGDRLAGGEYQPIPITRTPEGGYRGHSEALGLTLCWEHGQLRWWDPVAQAYLLTHDGEAEGRIAAEAQRDAALSQRDTAEAQRDAERQSRIAAEARVRRLEEELRRRSQ